METKATAACPLDITVKPLREWVTYNPATATYDTPDGTRIGAELVDSVECLADVLHIARLRKKQREALRFNAVVNGDQQAASPRGIWLVCSDNNSMKGDRNEPNKN